MDFQRVVLRVDLMEPWMAASMAADWAQMTVGSLASGMAAHLVGPTVLMMGCVSAV